VDDRHVAEQADQHVVRLEARDRDRPRGKRRTSPFWTELM
jgi:hypothetical protein